MNRWDLMYLTRPPWDSDRPLPALVALVEAGRLTPGQALDLGCGTGTNAIYLAQRGFTVAGVDIASRAIAQARHKAQEAGVAVDFRVGDVTDLPADLGPRDLALDVGCFHSLPAAGKPAYVRSLRRVLRPGGMFLLWAFLRDPQRPRPLFGPKGVTEEEVHTLFAPFFRIVEVQREDGWRPTALYIMEAK